MNKRGEKQIAGSFKTESNVFKMSRNLNKLLCAIDHNNVEETFDSKKRTRENIFLPERLLRKKTRRTLRKTFCKTHKNNFFSSFCYSDELETIKRNQGETNLKIDYLIDNLIDRKKMLSVDHFYHEIVSTSQEKKSKNEDSKMFDYFSFKVKPDMSLSSLTDFKDMKTVEREGILQSNFRHRKCHSPDKLITQKFFEDTDQFRNSNLMSVRTFGATNTVNPFCSSNKSDTEVKCKRNLKLGTETLEHIFQEEEKKANNKEDALSNLTNFSEPEIGVGKKEAHAVTDYEDKNEKREKSSDKQEKYPKGAFKKMITSVTNQSQSVNTFSDYNESVNSSKIGSCNDKYKKVRGFNFRNNINTKKYVKPLLSKQNSGSKQENETINSEQNSFVQKINNTEIENESSNCYGETKGRILRVNKSANFDEKPKAKKFNFSNNINIKKFIRSDSNVNQNNKEREKQYNIEIEIDADDMSTRKGD